MTSVAQIRSHAKKKKKRKRGERKYEKDHVLEGVCFNAIDSIRFISH